MNQLWLTRTSREHYMLSMLLPIVAESCVTGTKKVYATPGDESVVRGLCAVTLIAMNPSLRLGVHESTKVTMNIELVPEELAVTGDYLIPFEELGT